jgi:hypothetical protein
MTTLTEARSTILARRNIVGATTAKGRVLSSSLKRSRDTSGRLGPNTRCRPRWGSWPGRSSG